MTLPIVSNSEVKTFAECVRKHFYHYIRGRRAHGKADALRFGTLIHIALEAWWLELKAAQFDPLEVALRAIQQSDEVADPFELVKAEELMRGYHFRWFAEPLEVIGVEVEFRMPLVNPATGRTSKTAQVGGKIDAIVRDRNGDVWIIEHKTTAEDFGAGSTYWDRVRMSSQIGTYLHGARALGLDPAGCVYDVIGKVSLRPLKATPPESRKYTNAGTLYANQREVDETIDEYRIRVRASIAKDPNAYFGRALQVRLEEDEAESLADLWQHVRAMREAELANRFPRNPDACVRYGRTCDYFEVCSRRASIDDDTLFRTVKTKHEELTSTEAAQ